jgi:hypothetical protein
MNPKLRQIVRIFKIFDPKIHAYINRPENPFSFISIKSLSYIVEFINKDVNKINRIQD